MSYKRKKILLMIFVSICFFFFCQFDVFSAEKDTIINLEYPISNYQYKDIMYIQGYFETDIPNTTIKTTIDNEQVDIEYDRYERALSNEYNYNQGFYKTIDLKNIKDGKHTFEVELVDENNVVLDKQTKEINVKKYYSSLVLNYPITNYQYKDIMYIEGSFSTDCEEYTIEVNIDDKKIDMINSINNIFYTTLQTNGMSDGNHKITASLKDNKTGEILSTTSKTVLIKQYDIDMTINYPITAYKYKNIMYIEGQYTQKVDDLKIKLYIDNEYIDDNFQTKDNIYYRTLDLRQIKDGNHEMKISIYSGNNEIISKTKKISIEKYQSKIALEFPIENYMYNNAMYIQGWSLSECDNAKLSVAIDGNEINNIKRYNRNDLKKYNIKTSDEDGFFGTFDTTTITNGSHTVTATLQDTVTGEILASASKTISLKKYNALIQTEYPISTFIYKDQMYIQGYIDTDVPDSIVELYIDDNLITERANRYERNDFPSIYNNNNCGFYYTSSTNDLKDGIHSLKITVKSERFSNEIVETKTVKFKVKKYDGILVIETPTISQFSKTIDITGWEMSELDNSYIKIFIDGIDISNTLASPINRIENEEILNKGIYGGRLTNDKPVFTSSVDLSLISQGTHTISVKLYTKLDEEIANFTKKIMVYKNVALGIDVSSHNSITSWNSIKNEGIEYAFIRAAVRGYGINNQGIDGCLNEDTKFSTNVHGAKMSGIKIGAYVYSQAINEAEAIQEANLVLSLVQREGGKNTFSLPIVYDTEFTPCVQNGQRCGRADSLSKENRTRIAKAFLNTIKNAGYTPMIYSNKSFLYNNLDMNQLSEYEVWMANYVYDEYWTDPMNHQSNYTGPYQVWQYYSKGTLSGINGYVDMNIFYKQY